MRNKPHRRRQEQPERDLDRYHAYLAYDLGYRAGMLVLEATLAWQWADLEDTLPSHLHEHTQALVMRIEQLHQAYHSVKHVRAKKKAIQAVEKAWDCLRSSWLASDHRTMIRLREDTDPDHRSAEVLLRRSPFQQSAWKRLRLVIATFGQVVLPAERALWITLGGYMADVFFGPPDELPLGCQTRLQDLLTSMAGHFLLQGLALDLSRLPQPSPKPDTYASLPSAQVRANVAELAMHLQERFLNPSMIPADVPAPIARLGGEPAITDLNKEELRQCQAFLYAKKNPDWTVAQMATYLGCDRSTLYRKGWFKNLLHARVSGKGPPAGFRRRSEEGENAPTDVDGIDTRRPEDGYESDDE